MSEALSYESQFSKRGHVVFVDSESYGEAGHTSKRSGNYYFSKSHDFPTSTASRNLDLEVILRRLEKHVGDFGFGSPERIVRSFFVPSQDMEELGRRQAVVREIYEQRDLRWIIDNIITTSNKLATWTPDFMEKSVGEFGKRTEQVSHLVGLVESARSMDVESEVLRGVQDFAQTVAKREEYVRLRNYVEECAAELFREYRGSIKQFGQVLSVPVVGDSFNTTQLVGSFARLGKRKNYGRLVGKLDADSRRNIYSALRGLREVFHKLIHDDRLEGVIDRDEVETFGLEERLDEVITRLGDTAILEYRRRHKITEAQRFFIRQTSELLYHIDGLLDDGLKSNMGSLAVKTNDLGKELAFYGSLARLAIDMEHFSPIVMPVLLAKRSRSCKIVGGNIPSFVIRASSLFYYYEEDEGDPPLIPNDVSSNRRNHAFVITGANDNGKTTYQRMIGQIQVLAQVGSYVPAKRARISVVDGIFSSFGERDNPGEKEGTFRSGLSYLSFITIPQSRDREEGLGLLSVEDIRTQYLLQDPSFVTPYSLVLLDEIAIGSDSAATREAIERTLRAVLGVGATLYLSTHFHPIAEEIAEGKFPDVMNLGAILEVKEGGFVETYKIGRNRHEPSYGQRLFEAAGYTDERIEQANQRLVAAGVIRPKR